MNRLLRTALAAAALTALLAAAPLAHAGAPLVHDVTGDWHGFFQSSLTGEVGTFKLHIPFMQQRRFTGELHVPNPLVEPTTLKIPFDGTLAASLRFNVVGKGEHGMFVVNGDAHPLGDGTAWALAGFRLTTAQGTDQGTLFFLQAFHADDPPSLARDWAGTFTLEGQPEPGRVTVCISDQQDSGFAGMATLGEPERGGMVFPFAGTVSDLMTGEQGMESLLHAIGHTPEVMFRINGMFTPDATGEGGDVITAQFVATFGDGSVRPGSFTLVPAVQCPSDPS